MIVYWIRLKDQLDILVEGYVGVTINFNQRMSDHCGFTSKLNNHFGRAIRKYGWDNLIKEVIFTGTKDECFSIEKKLRPKFQIGWNEAIGGIGGDRSKFIDYKKRKNQGWLYNKNGNNNPFWGKKHSKETINKLSKNKCKYIITTPDGTFNGFNEAAKFYKCHKLTIKRNCGILEGWSYESK